MFRQIRGSLPPWVRLLVLGTSIVSFAADSPVSIQPRVKRQHQVRSESNIRVDSSLVMIPVSVTDLLNRPVIGLTKNNFRVFDSKVEQQVRHLVFEDSPLAVGIIFDSSGSMKRKLRRSAAAVAELLATSNSADEFFLVEFNDTASVTQPFSEDPKDIRQQLALTKPQGRTALLDAIALGLREVKKSQKARKALVIFSDGGDNRSRHTETQIRHMAEESDVLIYAMGIFEGGSAHNLSAEELAGPGLLADITERSGGRLFTVDNLQKLPETAARIGAELHSRYVLGYTPSTLRHDGKHHRVEVKVIAPLKMPPLRVDWRNGYREPAE